MEKKKFLGGTVVVVLLFIMMIVGCDMGNGGSEKNTDPKTIEISGISGFDGEEAYIRVFSDLNNITNHIPVNEAIGIGTVSGGTLSVELTVPNNDTGLSQEKWTGTGNYYIYLVGKNNDGVWSTARAWIYIGNGIEPLRYNINDAVIKLQYSTFKQYNVWKD
jgi:hypothetical protein